MLKMVGQDIVSGAMGFVGTEPGRLYQMGSLNGVAEASGNPLTLKRCKNKPLRGLTIYGKSEQFTTTGKNLANGQDTNCYINSSLNICGVTNNDTGMVIDVSKLTHATISTRSIQDRYRVGCVNTVPTVGEPITCYNGIGKDGTKDSCTIDTTDYNYLIVNATKIEDIQVEKGSEATYYEPYTGGQPSPSPDYPQEIKSVVEPTVKITGKNLLSFPYADNSKVENGVSFELNDDGSVKIKGTASSTTYFNFFQNNDTKCLKIPNGVFKLKVLGKKSSNIVFASGTNMVDTDGVLKIETGNAFGYCYITKGDSVDETIYPMILVADETDETYKPYHEQTVTLPYTLNAIPVSSGGNYTDENGQQWIADYVDVKRGKLVRCVETATFDGSEDEKWNLNTNNNARMFTTTTFNPFSKASITDAPYIISNMFKFINVNWGVQNRNRIYIETSGRLNIEAPDIEDVDYLKTLLKAENLICHAYRGKTTEIDLTPDEITAYKALHTYTGITNISNDAEAWMQVVYDT